MCALFCVENHEGEIVYPLPRLEQSFLLAFCHKVKLTDYGSLCFLWLILGRVLEAHTLPSQWCGFMSYTSSRKHLPANQYAERLSKTGNRHHSMSNFSLFSLVHLLKVRDYIYRNQIYLDIEKISSPAYCFEMGCGVERLPSGFWKVHIKWKHITLLYASFCQKIPKYLNSFN